jgi:DNA modification methylase
MEPTTRATAAATGARVFAMEISPAYVDFAVKRWLAGGEGRRVICNGVDMTGRSLTPENA